MKSQKKWLSEDAVIGNVEMNWENTIICPFYVQPKPIFHFKFLHRRLATNDFLHKIGLKEVDSCSFCDDATETLVHLLW